MDDDPAHRDGLREVLEELGWTVELAEDGIAALGHALRAGPDIILLDLQLPNMDGAETLRRLRGSPARRAIPVVLVTGRRVPAWLRGSCDAVVEKPFRVERLLGVMARLASGYALAQPAGPEHGDQPSPA